jgi:hypothetical protein
MVSISCSSPTPGLSGGFSFVHVGERRPNGVFPLIGKKFNDGKFHMPRDGHKESQLVNVHDVNAESHFVIQQKDVRRNRRHSGRNMRSE